MSDYLWRNLTYPCFLFVACTFVTVRVFKDLTVIYKLKN